MLRTAATAAGLAAAMTTFVFLARRWCQEHGDRRAIGATLDALRRPR